MSTSNAPQGDIKPPDKTAQESVAGKLEALSKQEDPPISFADSAPKTGEILESNQRGPAGWRKQMEELGKKIEESGKEIKASRQELEEIWNSSSDTVLESVSTLVSTCKAGTDLLPTVNEIDAQVKKEHATLTEVGGLPADTKAPNEQQVEESVLKNNLNELYAKTQQDGAKLKRVSEELLSGASNTQALVSEQKNKGSDLPPSTEATDAPPQQPEVPLAARQETKVRLSQSQDRAATAPPQKSYSSHLITVSLLLILCLIFIFIKHPRLIAKASGTPIPADSQTCNTDIISAALHNHGVWRNYIFENHPPRDR